MTPSALGAATTAALLLASTAGASASAASSAACARAADLLASQCTPGLGPWAGHARCCAPLAALKALGCDCEPATQPAVDRALAARGVGGGPEGEGGGG
jgi:hypothetical protein